MMESFVNCPNCNGQVRVVMNPYQEGIRGIMEIFDDVMGGFKTNHFEGEGKCDCGSMITASLHVTTEALADMDIEVSKEEVEE